MTASEIRTAIDARTRQANESRKVLEESIKEIRRLRRASKIATAAEKRVASIIGGSAYGSGARRILVQGWQFRILDAMEIGKEYTVQDISRMHGFENRSTGATYGSLNKLAAEKLVKKCRAATRANGISFRKLQNAETTTRCGARLLGS